VKDCTDTMSESEYNSESNQEKVTTFVRRKSKIQKAIDNCISVAQTDFITVRNEDSAETYSLGFTPMFLTLVDNRNLLYQFGNLSHNELKITREFFEKVLLPLIFDTPAKLELVDKIEDYIWSKIYCDGGSTSFHKNTERVAFGRLKKNLEPKHGDLLEEIKDAAFALLETDPRPMLRQHMALCEVLNSGSTIYYNFFVLPEEVKGQLADTICMNTCISIEFDAYQEIFERFVRNQLLIFSKTHHSLHANGPSETLDHVSIGNVTETTLLETINECVAALKITRGIIYDSQKAYETLVKRAQIEISPSELTVTKTVLRQWANSHLADEENEYAINNSYDSAFCRLIEYLGMTYAFGVRGKFRFPIEISGVRNVKKRRVHTGLNPDDILRKFDDGIEKLSIKITELKNKKRVYENSEEVQEYIKRQRQDIEVENIEEL